MKHLKAVVAVLIMGLFALLPLKWSQALGRFFARWAGVDKGMGRITRINIARCFPELSAADQSALVQASLAHTGMMFTEAGMSWLWPVSRSLKKIVAINNEHLLQQAVAEQQGVILLAPHLGNWEMLNLYVSSKYGITVMYKPPKLHLLDKLIRKMRARLGSQMAPANSQGVRLVLRTLREGGMIGVLPDQEPETGGVFVPFFGHSAYTMKLVPQLIKQTGARVIYGYAERLDNAKGFALHFAEADPAILTQEISESAAAMNRSVEACVRHIPSQYQWEYKRFNHQPDGVESPYRR